MKRNGSCLLPKYLSPGFTNVAIRTLNPNTLPISPIRFPAYIKLSRNRKFSATLHLLLPPSLSPASKRWYQFKSSRAVTKSLAIGFSERTSLPASSAFRMYSGWTTIGNLISSLRQVPSISCSFISLHTRSTNTHDAKQCLERCALRDYDTLHVFAVE